LKECLLHGRISIPKKYLFLVPELPALPAVAGIGAVGAGIKNSGIFANPILDSFSA
jgi:hypothetical protein